MYAEANQFRTQAGVIAELSDLQLPGPHNVENACAALTVALEMGVDPNAMREGLRECKGLEHRLEVVRTVDGVEYVNDSFSSAPSATIAALRSYEVPKIMIIGGRNKGADFSSLARELAIAKAIKSVLLVGESRQQIAAVFAQHAVPAVELLDLANMADIVQAAKDHAADGDVVILSPGCSSFDMFKDFYDRGEQFKQEVAKL